MPEKRTRYDLLTSENDWFTGPAEPADPRSRLKDVGPTGKGDPSVLAEIQDIPLGFKQSTAKANACFEAVIDYLVRLRQENDLIIEHLRERTHLTKSVIQAVVRQEIKRASPEARTPRAQASAAEERVAINDLIARLGGALQPIPPTTSQQRRVAELQRRALLNEERMARARRIAQLGQPRVRASMTGPVTVRGTDPIDSIPTEELFAAVDEILPPPRPPRRPDPINDIVITDEMINDVVSMINGPTSAPTNNPLEALPRDLAEDIRTLFEGTRNNRR